MLRIRMHAPTQKSFEQFRADLDSAIEASIAGPVMVRKWDRRTLHMAAPATSGAIRYEDSGVYAEFQISWPGLPMKDIIIGESHRILAAAAGCSVTRLA